MGHDYEDTTSWQRASREEALGACRIKCLTRIVSPVLHKKKGLNIESKYYCITRARFRCKLMPERPPIGQAGEPNNTLCRQKRGASCTSRTRVHKPAFLRPPTGRFPHGPAIAFYLAFRAEPKVDNWAKLRRGTGIHTHISVPAGLIDAAVYK